jgi:acyl-coenzyme A synthetase/AMP-(fatty) acid ligase
MPGFVAANGMTVWFSTPSAIGMIRRTGGLSPTAMPSLRWSFFAGEALSCQDAEDWHRAAPYAALENLYGPTELTITVTGHRWTGERTLNGIVPIGSVHPGHYFMLVDPEGAPCRNEGELCITGRQLTPGYIDPTDNLGRFFYFHGERWYRTGDRVRCGDNGKLLYLGRNDAQVQVHGVRVELAEVEAAVRSCRGVQDAVVVALPAQGSVELMVFYTGALVPPVQLVRDLRDVLPAATIPKKYRHVAEFPLNSNRKIDRKRLALEAAAAAA